MKTTPKRWVTELRKARRESKDGKDKANRKQIMADFKANDSMERAGNLDEILEAVNKRAAKGVGERNPIKQLREIGRLANYCRLPQLVAQAALATVREAPRVALRRIARAWS